jgi:hypothetical protein
LSEHAPRSIEEKGLLPNEKVLHPDGGGPSERREGDLMTRLADYETG